MSKHFDLVVVGAGPAGAAAALTASRRGLQVALLEAGRFPRHKVCGEFVSAESAEVLRYLLGAASERLLEAPRISRARLHARGNSVAIRLEPAAYSIPRYVLDEALWQAANQRGITCRNELVVEANPVLGGFAIRTGGSVIHCGAVINASGRWSRLTRRIKGGVPWVGLKAHFRGDADDSVDLYFTKHGYCGVQMVSPGVVNACALVRQGTASDLNELFAGDPALAACTRSWKVLTETFATAPVHLGPGEPVIDGMLQVGDAAGFVDPFVGDGISMALRSGVLAGRSVLSVSAERYAELYRESFSGIFRNTGRLRSLLEIAAPLRPALLQLFRVPSVGRRIFSATRRAKLDVLTGAIP